MVFVDESGIDSFISKSFGWALRGEKVLGEVSGRRFARESFLAAQCGQKILAPFCFQGTCNTHLFEMWIRDFLLPVLSPGHVIIMDNATFHKSETTRKLIESAGCNLVFLPAYSPDLNPIEKFWAWFKAKLKTVINSFNSLQEAIDHVFSL